MEILNKTVNVLNRGTAEVGYTLHDSGVRRNWMPNEIKKNMTVRELEQLTYIPGGLKLLQKYLVINDPDVCEYLGLETEPEYFYTEADVRTLLTTGTLDQLLDCLDFAPEGVIDLIKKLSIACPRISKMSQWPFLQRELMVWVIQKTMTIPDI